MPTPSNTREQAIAPPHHSSCPPEVERFRRRHLEMDIHNDRPSPLPETLQTSSSPTNSHSFLVYGGNEEEHIMDTATSAKLFHTGASRSGTPSSIKTEEETESDSLYSPGIDSSMMFEFSNKRLIPISSSCFLRAGSRYKGTQKSEKQIYDVQVEIKYVDIGESFLCGFLQIQGLTKDHPTLSTYFEGEIIGSKYTFLTQHQDWGSNDKDDLTHWAKFSSFRPFSRKAKKGSLIIPHLTQRETIFMRWKEQFLVPDHRVRNITDASFDGFYYICFNQIQGTVSGIYFHAKSEKFQKLELKHIEDRGCYAAMEFR
ncbi:hypothetical protein K3495_g10166 [Podosphaera aphanis]|nr:hypothetical protein K3495_g10166 [Podosphaera aphanis]